MAGTAMSTKINRTRLIAYRLQMSLPIGEIKVDWSSGQVPGLKIDVIMMEMMLGMLRLSTSVVYSGGLTSSLSSLSSWYLS